MPETKINLELLRTVRKQISYFPNTYNQGDWGHRKYGSEGTSTPCGTTACIAGHAMLASGYVLPRSHFYDAIEFRQHGFNGERLVAATEAQKLLGLTWAQHMFLFFSSASDVLAAIDCLLEGHDPIVDGHSFLTSPLFLADSEQEYEWECDRARLVS